MKKQDEMRREYDFTGGVRGKFYGKITDVRVIKSNGAAKEEEEIKEINSLFSQLWSKAEGQEGYKKSEWMKLGKLLRKKISLSQQIQNELSKVFRALQNFASPALVGSLLPAPYADTAHRAEG